MGLDTVVSEDKWKLQGGGSNPDGYSSTFQRKKPNTSPVEYDTKNLTVTFVEVYEEYKHYALTKDACTNYITAHPELALTYTRQNEYSDGYTLSKRLSAKTSFAYTLTDVPAEGS
jgi:hypothetical protein